MNARALLAALFVALTTTGCSFLYQEKFVDPEYDLREESVVIVPFKDLKKWYYEVDEGRELARWLIQSLSGGECELEIVGGREVEEAVWDNVDELDWGDVGRAAEADYILFGTIRDLRNDSQAVVGFVQGTLIIDFSIWDVNKDELAFQRKFRTVYPEDIESGEIGVSFEQSREELRKRLFLQASKRVAAILCGEWIDRY